MTDQTETITLYHGSIHLFESIDVTKGKPLKDFGTGFYTTRDINHAENLAKRNLRFEKDRLSELGSPTDIKMWLYSYKFDIKEAAELSVKIFPTADTEWIKFIVENRTKRERTHNFDIVIGPTADDNTRATIRTVINAAQSGVLNDRELSALALLIEPDRLPTQYFFGTNRGAALLHFSDRREIV
ncbi:MAG: DUF3990 domain-containing protein [Ruminococcus sp.]|nr:DUF3990 domain-containing protein [Ruminococcus sp.]